MAINFNNPVTSDGRAAVLATIREHFIAMAKLFDGETMTGTPTNAIRYNSGNSQLERFNGTSWALLPQPYLPLTGGTLTGGLSGTSGAFTSLTVGGSAVWHAGNLNPASYQLAATAWNTSNFNPANYQLASTAWNTSNFNPANYQLASTAWNTSNFNPASYAPLAGASFSGSVTATALAAPSLTATGAGAVVYFQQRDNTSINWAWYATGGLARLWNGSSDILTVSSTGLLTMAAAAFSGNMSAAAGTFSGALTGASLNTSGNLSVSGTADTGALTVTGSITASGNITAFSDRRLKSHIEDYDLGIDAILSMPLKRYHIKGVPSAGVIAQDVEAVAPLFTDQTHQYLSVDYGRLAFAMVASLVRELRNRAVV